MAAFGLMSRETYHHVSPHCFGKGRNLITTTSSKHPQCIERETVYGLGNHSIIATLGQLPAALRERVHSL